MPKGSKYISVEQPDKEVVIDFLSFHPERGLKVPGATVKVRLDYNHATQKATLYVEAKDDADARILVDVVEELTVEEEEEA
jgi:hypothetical protein